MNQGSSRPLGAHLSQGACSFCVWAPHARRVDLEILGTTPRRVPMRADGGYFHADVTGVADGDRYGFHLDEGPLLPDPASRLQAEGVHGPSTVVGAAFDWKTPDWKGLPLADYIAYELHVGTFTPAGTFDAVAERLPDLRALGVTAIELMPVAQFPGSRNWGYDGVYPFATQHSYGGPLGLKRFVDACHAHGMAVILDVVYNHIGPEGNYIGQYGPYFIDRYRTPWGDALNFDGPESDAVREYFIRNALQWTDEFRIDALRLDAVHAILDTTAIPFLTELSARVHERAAENGRTCVLIAESDLGDPRMVRPRDLGGHGMDAQWMDDFHHALHALLTGEQSGYYMDFGKLEQLASAYRSGFVYAGQRSAYRRRRHGAPAHDVPPHRFIVYSQNHDQVGNRMRGDRLCCSLTHEQQKLAAAAVLLSPFTPMLFMGEEYGELAPFPYFVSHSDEELVTAVRAGRAAEFADFSWAGEPPDPQSEETFRSAVLDWNLRTTGRHALLLKLHRDLIAVRKAHLLEPAAPGAVTAEADETTRILSVRRSAGGGDVLLVMNFGAAFARVAMPAGSNWVLLFDTGALQYGDSHDERGPAFCPPSAAMRVAPYTALLYRAESV